MSLIVLALRLVLAGVFALAAYGKLTDRSGTREAVRSFRLPGPLVGPVAFCLPLLEIVVVALLLPGALAWWGAFGALALLVAFDAGITVSLARGDAPDCHCFGQLHSEPIGPATLVRNGVLAAAAVFILAQGNINHDPAAFHRLALLSAGEWIAVLAAAAGSGLLLVALAFLRELIQQNKQILLRIKMIESDLRADRPEVAGSAISAARYGLPPGTIAPSFSLPDTEGHIVSLQDLYGIGKPLLLLFTSPNCEPCNALMPEIGHWQRDHGRDVELVVISSGSTLEIAEEKRSSHGLERVLFAEDRSIETEFEVPGTPAAVLIRPDGTIGSPVGGGAEEVRWLLNEVLTMVQPSDYQPNAVQLAGLKFEAQHREIIKDSFLGQPAPALELPDLEGNLVQLSDLLVGETLVLFWSSTCVYCRGMTEDLHRWDSMPPPGAPRLVVIASGLLEEARSLHLHSPVLFDREFATAASFGVNATPVGIVIDASRTIASQIGGATDIIRLLNGAPEVVLAGVNREGSPHG